MKVLIQCLAVGGGGFLGALARFFVASACGRWFRTGFPLGTFIINITGSLFLGWFLTVMRARAESVTMFNGALTISAHTLTLAVAMGFVGAYTTFSTFMSESNALLEDGFALQAMAYLIGSVAVGLIAVKAGIWLAGH